MSTAFLARTLSTVIGSAIACGVAFGEPIHLSTSHVFLNPDDPSQLRVGQLRFLGGLRLKSNNPAFGGFSGLSVINNDHFIAVTDRGQWLSARIVRDSNGHLVGLADGELAPLRDMHGQPVIGRLRDAEALERMPNGDYLVSFERNHRVWRYDATTGALRGHAIPLVEMPKAIHNAPPNGGLEAIAPLTDNRILMLTENFHNDNGAVAGWLIDDTTSALSFRPTSGFRPTDAATLPNGDVLILSRSFNRINAVAARLERVPASTIRPGAVLQGDLIASFRSPLTVDNFEGVATVQSESGEQIVYILSDDNFSMLQRTLLLLFQLEEEESRP